MSIDLVIARNGADFLLVDRAKYRAGEKNAPAMRFNIASGHKYGPAPLQRWLKFGVWVDADEDDLKQAKRIGAGQ